MTTPTTYDEVNINKYKLLKDDDATFFDRQAKLFTNAKGKAKLTTAGVSADGGLFFTGQIDDAADWYDFDKKEFTTAGRNWYTKQMQNASEDEKNAHLTEVEKELEMALINDYKKRKKTDPDAVKNNLIATLNIDSGGGSEEKKASIYDLQKEFQEIRQSDRTLQRLSLRNLKYPIDADYGNTQDYIEINQFTYKAVNPSVIFPQKGFRNDGNFIKDSDSPDYKGGGTKESGFQAGGRIAGDTLLKGLDRGSPKNIPIGLVKLPMPNQLNDSNNIAWGEDQLNALTAAAATLGAGGVQQGIDFIDQIQKGDIKNPIDALGKIFNGIGESGKSLKKFFQDEVLPNKNANLLTRSVVGSSLLNLLGVGISPETLLARGAGVIPNSNLELLFNAPALRAFRFDWKMSPRSREEAIRINNIIRFFKQGMAAKKMMEDSPGGSAYFLGTPNVFDIAFKTSKTNRGITNTNNSVLRIKTCACVGAAVNYTPQGMWNAYEEGQPTSCILSLQFKELEPIFNTDYEEDPFEYKNLVGAIPIDAVGY